MDTLAAIAALELPDTAGVEVERVLTDIAELLPEIFLICYEMPSAILLQRSRHHLPQRNTVLQTDKLQHRAYTADLSTTYPVENQSYRYKYFAVIFYRLAEFRPNCRLLYLPHQRRSINLLLPRYG